MSLADDAILATSPAFAAVHADEWLILGTGVLAGVTFQADAQTEPPLVLDTDLGSDAREQTFVYVDRAEMNRLIAVAAGLDSTALPINRNTILQGKGTQWRVVGDIDDNPANYRVKFQVVKIVAGKDSP